MSSGSSARVEGVFAHEVAAESADGTDAIKSEDDGSSSVFILIGRRGGGKGGGRCKTRATIVRRATAARCTKSGLCVLEYGVAAKKAAVLWACVGVMGTQSSRGQAAKRSNNGRLSLSLTHHFGG